MNIVLTGASSGIGFHTALEFLKDQDAQVFVISRNESKLKLLNDEHARRSGGGKLVVFSGDITLESDRNKFRKLVEQGASSLDILVNNAGLLINKRFDELTWEDWNKVYNTNVFGAAAITKEFLPLLKSNPLGSRKFRSHIVNIGSMGGLGGTSKFKGLSAYSSSKGALAILTECLAEEFSEDKIAVNGLALGSVETEMFSKAFPGLSASGDAVSMAEYIVDFAIRGPVFYNGKNLPVSNSTP